MSSPPTLVPTTRVLDHGGTLWVHARRNVRWGLSHWRRRVWVCICGGSRITVRRLTLHPIASTRNAATISKWWSWGLATVRIGCTARDLTNGHSPRCHVSWGPCWCTSTSAVRRFPSNARVCEVLCLMKVSDFEGIAQFWHASDRSLEQAV